MPVQRLNHAVLYVRDVERSFAFYRDVLGFRAKVEIPGRAVFLQAEGSTNGALVGASDHATTKALYAADPDGIEFEVSWLLPADLITPEVSAQGATTRPLDLEREIERYGAQTRGGIGVSVPA